MNVPTLPMMNGPEIDAMRVLLSQRAPKRVLEWGSGGSTVYWPTHYPDIEWVAVEHDPGWASSVKAKAPANAKVLHRTFPEYWRLDEGMFDLIIVDGRERVRCLDVARSYLNPGGVVVLHDASRRRYAPGLAYYRTTKVLVPPVSKPDARGLTLLMDPEPYMDVPPTPLRQTGAMYLCWGGPASAQALSSIQSLRKHLPGLPVVVLGDAGAVEAFRGTPGVTVIKPDVNPFKGEHMFGFLAGRVKPLLARHSPFARTVYVDADTEFKGSPQAGFDLLDRWDFVIAEAETRSLALTFPDNRTEAGETAARLGTSQLLYHNSGLFFWRTNAATTQLFRLWGDEWMRYQGWDEQIALLRALLVSDAVWLNVPYTWNCRSPSEAWMVYHRFAGRSARKFGGQNGFTVVRNPRGVPAPPSRPLVRVEVAPGRYIRVHVGDEEKAKAAFLKTQPGGRRARTGG